MGLGCEWILHVIGTVLALMLGMMTGFRMVLLLSCLCYAIAFVAITRLAIQGRLNASLEAPSVPRSAAVTAR